MSNHGNECDVCDWESSCFDAPMDNCTSFQNIDVRSLEDTIKSCQRAINIIKQGQKQIEQAKVEGAREFAEWLSNTEYVANHDSFILPLRGYFTVDDVVAEYEKEQKE